MSIVVECQTCRKKKKAPQSLAGKRVRCKCGGVIAVPDTVPEEAIPAELDLSEVSLLSTGENLAPPTTCPSCMAVMPEGAILCVQCGFNKQTGQRVGATDDAPAPAPDDKATPAMKRKKVEAHPPPAWVGKAFKGVVVLGLLGGFAFVAWHIVAAVTFDPTAQREADMLKVSPKMKVEDVVAAIGRPPKEILAERDPAKSDNVVKFVPRKLFWSQDFMTKYTAEDLQFGFTFVYKYTEREQLRIWFNPNGEVEYMEKHDPLKMLWDR